VLPNEKHEFSMGWRDAQKSGLAGCTTGWAVAILRGGLIESHSHSRHRPVRQTTMMMPLK